MGTGTGILINHLSLIINLCKLKMRSHNKTDTMIIPVGVVLDSDKVRFLIFNTLLLLTYLYHAFVM